MPTMAMTMMMHMTTTTIGRHGTETIGEEMRMEEGRMLLNVTIRGVRMIMADGMIIRVAGMIIVQ